jgi:hypothetical protein
MTDFRNYYERAIILFKLKLGASFFMPQGLHDMH